MATQRLTPAQAVIKFLKHQYTERDGKEHRFFAGCFGIFGHGNVAGIGQALQQNDLVRGFQQMADRTTVLHIRTDRYESIRGYESCWDVPVAEASEMDTVKAARKDWEEVRST